MAAFAILPLPAPPGARPGRPGLARWSVRRGDLVVAIGEVDPAGRPTAPEAASLRIERVGDPPELPAGATPPPATTMLSNLLDPATELRPLLGTLLDAARTTGARRAVIGWDPMDAPGQRLLAELGFRPTGTPPYFERGPAGVEYVSGYADATGAAMDFGIALDSETGDRGSC